jgi:hypothetical protein
MGASISAAHADILKRIEALRPGIRALEAVDAYFQEKKAEGELTIRELAQLADVPYGTARRVLLQLQHDEVLLLTPGCGRDPDVFGLPIARDHDAERRDEPSPGT